MGKNKFGFIIDSSIGVYGKDIVSSDTKQVFFDIIDKNGVQYVDDNTSLNSETILKAFDEGNFFKTSAVSPGKVMMALEELFDDYENVILFTASSGLSSFYSNSLFLEEEYKGKFFVVDTKEIGYAIKTMVEKAKEMLNNGEELETVLSFCRNYYKYNYTSFTCENWSPLVNSGRVPKSLSKFLNVLKTKPVINFDIKNRLGGIVKSFEKSVDKIFDQFKKAYGNEVFSNIEYVVFYNNKIENSKAEYIREKITKIFNISKDKIIEMFVPNIVLVYTANGSFGIHIRSKSIAKNREEE